jgi:hypothetical protein
MQGIKYIGLNSIAFTMHFRNDENCLKYLAEIKWHKGYVCIRCGHDKYCNGKKPYSRRCNQCGYDESPTAGTMFNKCKFPLHIAFHMAFKISTKKKGISTLELSREFGLRQKTCWEFKKKLQQAMKSSKQYKLTGEVFVDEFLIGEKEENQQGRSHGKKRLVVIALEKVKRGVGRAYAKVIEAASAKEFKPFFRDYINNEANVTTDEWNGYKPLKKEYPNLIQIPSSDGNNFPDIHIHIMNIKGWLRGIHHHCGKEHLQGYLDEYHFRYNRRNNMDTIFHLLIKRMVDNKPIR